MNRQRLQFATTAFLGEMRRQAAKAAKNTTIQSLDEYPPEQRSALMSAIEKAIKAADPAADQTFQNWLAKQQKDPAST
ncbi:hypothetical protein PXK56_18385 [Phaeobacter gallaeciensis]|uniref:hypothetical protein n=1 Tax=Phaeobacter gallaeciensis TaxID=60890 RepID=UPI0023809F94|nr:hypothetical protein [Phaeobacter gallaeciensis]MDE4297156.1 hypothetical protein [Phaeobacter gallaeciensis]